MPRTRPRIDVPLGSLTQRGAATGGGCRSCGAQRVMRIEMSLTDGTPVSFVSCHTCETKRWEHEGRLLPMAEVIARTRKPACPARAPARGLARAPAPPRTGRLVGPPRQAPAP